MPRYRPHQTEYSSEPYPEFAGTAYGRAYAGSRPPIPEEQVAPQEQYATSAETAAKYPWVEQVAQERIQFEQARDYLIGQGLKSTEANNIAKSNIELKKKSNVENIKNQALQQTYILSDTQRNLEAHNDALQAGIELHGIDITDPEASQKLARLSSRLAKHSGTKAAEGIFTEIKSAQDEARRQAIARSQQQVQERLATTEERKALQATPAYIAEAEKARVKANLDEQEASKLRLAKQYDLLHPGEKEKQARQEAAQMISIYGKQQQDILGGFKLKEYQSPTLLDEEGKKTKDPSKAAYAGWLDTKGKVREKMPIQQWQENIGKVRTLQQYIEDAGSSLYPSKPSGEQPMQEPKPTEATQPIAKTPSVAEPTPPSFSTANPYAESAIKETTAKKEKEANIKAGKQIMQTRTAIQELKKRKKELETIPESVSVPGEIFGSEKKLTESQRASEYEKRKTIFEDAQKKVLHLLADELGPNATKENLMDLAKERGYTF